MLVQASFITYTRLATALATLLALDAVWFSVSLNRVYPPFTDVKLAWGLLAWVPLAIAIVSANPGTASEALQWGAAVGFTTYAVFNGTELAIRPDWTPAVGMIDLAWGTFACSAAAYAVHALRPWLRG